jgi:rhodanese-related sulfurtransferase
MSMIRRGSMSFLLLCVAALPLGGCRGDTKPAETPAATRPDPPPDFQIKPILREFLKNLPADEYLISARQVASAKQFIVDVRQPEEYAGGFIEGAVNVPLRELAVSLRALPSVDRPLAVVCDTGHRSAIGMAVLQMLGYRNARTLDRGIEGWREAGLNVVTAPVPRRGTGPAAPVDAQLQAVLDYYLVDAQLQAVLDYYLVHNLPFNWGAMSGADLTFDQTRKSSTELDPNADTYEQGASFLTDVDELGEFTDAQRRTAKLSKAINLPLRNLTDVLDRIPMRQAVTKI